MTILVLVIAAGVAIVLVVPVRIDLELDMAAEPSRQSVRVQVRWLFFAWRSGTPRRARPARAPRLRSRTHSGRRLRPRRILAAIRTRGFLGRTGRLAGDLMRALAPPTMDGWVRLASRISAFYRRALRRRTCRRGRGAGHRMGAPAGTGVLRPGIGRPRAGRVGRAPWRGAVAGRDVRPFADYLEGRACYPTNEMSLRRALGVIRKDEVAGLD